MIRERKRIKRGKIDTDRPLPYVDLNDPNHRNAFFIFSIGTVIFLFLSAVGSYEAFHYSESVEFCGTICHKVMNPEYIAYQNSPHASVKCVDCHVGEGVNWYMRSKLSGLRQVYNVTIGDYERPIPTPIKNLRPARETCEKCHWPEKFYSRNLRMQRHYLRDVENTEWDISMIMKVGATYSALGLQEGIHWHINPNVKVEYVSRDFELQDIPWVKLTDKTTGQITIFESEYDPLEEGKLDSLEVREMDCIDCHNRPSHKYNPPEYFLNDEITAGNIPRELPEIKVIGLEVCFEEYSTKDSAFINIEQRILEFYADNYPEIFEEKKNLIIQAISAIQDVFSKNIFPEMNVRWDKYRINIGHTKFNGCFRCHSDNHSSEDGKIISKDCNLCHTINAQGPIENMEYANFNERLEFIHPGGYLEKEDWEDGFCTDCHEREGP
jgi:nitrate/TMAO reductase-like tetraheme cytochrome c subunit